MVCSAPLSRTRTTFHVLAALHAGSVCHVRLSCHTLSLIHAVLSCWLSVAVLCFTGHVVSAHIVLGTLLVLRLSAHATANSV